MLPVTSGQPVFTADELLRLPSGRARYELVRGELRVMTPAGHLHGKVAMRVGQLLAAHVDANQLGIAYAAETGFVLSRDPDTVRAPDAAFVTAAHLASVSLSPEGYFPGAPDLAIEVVSPSESRAAVSQKTDDWLLAGCLVVVVLDPARNAGAVHRAGKPVESLAGDDRLSIPEHLPGWSVTLRTLFV